MAKIDDLGEKGFCAVVHKGKTQQKQSKDIADFKPLIEQASEAWVDYFVDDFEKEALKAATELGFSKSIVENLLKKSRSGYEDFGTELGIRVPAIRVEGLDVRLEPILILVSRNVLATIHTGETKRFFRIRRYAETLLKKLPENKPPEDRMTILLLRIIDENNARNFDHLHEIEEAGDALNRVLADPKTPRDKLGHSIYHMKHALIQYLGGLWATVDALNSLRYGDADLLSDDPKILDRINGLVGEVHSQIGLAEHLSDVLASGLEVLQSIYNNQLQVLNNKMALLVAYLTIIGTALLVPNTIATVAGNSMFEFTKGDVSWYIGLIVVSTFAATLVSWFAVKRMGLLPKSPE
ncbi:CorA-like Mg2+ transporter protein [uncultured archaeon]|nr:CorA-like Mg2+ transporter protein [uncultured archaeon]